ncbi:MAG: 4-(cytidine 5'-diphospho)-2-C-methyl-D-erythritol kinase [Mycobacteriaceae bacterium]
MFTVTRSPVTVRVPAKVNLHLAVGGLRDDGYHELTTVFQALSLYDDITVRPAEELSITVSGEGKQYVPTDSRNLAWRAVELLAEASGRIPAVAVEIVKGIPVAGGMAGGSADAAGTLTALNSLWQLGLGRDELDSFAAELGSDVPFALHGGTAIGTGRGEQLIPVLSRSTFHWVLALAKGGLSTPKVFSELDHLRKNGSPPQRGGPEDLIAAVASGMPERLAALVGNDLQPAALSLEPQLRRTLRAGAEAGALAGLVSGSGPTCAFLCESAQAAIAVSSELAGAGVCRTVRVAQGPVSGARILAKNNT